MLFKKKNHLPTRQTNTFLTIQITFIYIALVINERIYNEKKKKINKKSY